ncbi:MAG TPA: four helix bundle protein [Thermoanaerobaculia bacterium]
MGTVSRFEDLKAWQQARVLARSLYGVSGAVEKRRDFALVLQLRKTAMSPMSNIAEGFGRRSDRDFANFLSIAHGSVAEGQSLLYLSLDEGYIDQEAFDAAYEEADHCSRLIQSLGRYLGRRLSKKAQAFRSRQTPQTP